MAFVFRLDNVLRYRKFREQTARKQWLDAESDRMRQQKAVESLLTRRAEIAERCRQCCRSGVDTARYRLYLSYLHGIDRSIEQARVHLRGKEKILGRKAAALKQARIDRKIVEILRQRRQERYETETARQEQQILDEMVLMRFGRQT